ncbi:hypothetical protein [Microbacterium binotii]|uniref:Uncharacterized protein n=1 Tax=Microbacterium binotii TaxID=462710 RepID=A0ABN3PIW0_9MICO
MGFSGEPLDEKIRQFPVCGEDHAHVCARLIDGPQPLAAEVGDRLSASRTVGGVDLDVDPGRVDGNDGADADCGGERVVQRAAPSAVLGKVEVEVLVQDLADRPGQRLLGGE